MQGIAGEINKMKRASLLCSISLHNLSRTYFVGDQLQKDARSWISPPDPSKNYNIACEAYQTGTGEWFFQGGVFSQWSSKGTVLWIHGKRARASLISVLWVLTYSLLQSRFGKNYSYVCYFSSSSLCVTQTLCQLLNRSGHRSHVRKWIGIDGILLFRFQGYRKAKPARPNLFSPLPALRRVRPLLRNPCPPIFNSWWRDTRA